MPPVSKVEQLPEALRNELDRKIIAGAFSGYRDLEAWLKSQGVDISYRTLARRGQRLERKLAAIKASTEAALLIAEAAPDEEDARSAAAISLVQTDIFDTLVNLQEAETATDAAERLKLLGKAAKSIAELTRASVTQKRWAQSIRDKLAKDLTALRDEGFDPATLHAVEEKVKIYLPDNQR